MWPTDDTWMNALIFAACGSALILVAALGSVLGQSAIGRRVLKSAPVGLALLVAVYVAVALLTRPPSREDCIYTRTHPSDCRTPGSSRRRRSRSAPGQSA